MSIDVTQIEDLTSFITYVDTLPLDFSLSRGQVKDFPLLPSGLRTDNDENRIYSKAEIKQFLENFKIYSMQYINHTYNIHNDYEWMVFAQHFGIPTRLLDFSFSPLTALLFSIENAFDINQPEEPSVVWFLNPKELNEKAIHRSEIINISQDSTVNLESLDYPVAVLSKMINERIYAQNGCFVSFSSDSNSLESLMDSSLFLKKVIIPCECKKNIMSSLYKIGYRFTNIYPELESIAKDAKMKLNVAEYIKGADKND